MGYQNKCPACREIFPRSRTGVVQKGRRLFCCETCAGAGAAPPKGVDPIRRRARSIQQETRIAVQIGGRRVPGSGALPGSPGDVVQRPEMDGQSLLIEAKFTDAAQYTLKAETWRKVQGEAILARRIPVMQVRIGGLELAVLGWDEFLEMRGGPP